MAKNLVIVESPAKAKTIEKYLGADFHVLSSVGHIRSIPKKTKDGTPPVDIANDFKTIYETDPEKRKVVSELKKEVKAVGKDNVWLATDEDREGEAIAWHLTEALGLDVKTTKRIVFHEITKAAIEKAVANPRVIDMELVEAQQARQILDRIVGFELSPVVWRKVPGGKSAGRVQSPAVRLLVEREAEIKAFEGSAEFKVTATFYHDKLEFSAELPQRFSDEPSAHEFLLSLQSADFFVEDISKKPGTRNPGAPFTTSTLQQTANSTLGFSSKATMSAAQKLYQAGKITYMRTDSTNLSGEAIASAKDYIKRLYGPEYSQVRQFKTKNQSAQEAHEAIRPTDMSLETASNNDYDQKLYDLIRRRTLASQMAPAKLEKTVATIAFKPTIATGSQSPVTATKFESKGETIVFDGFLRVQGRSKENILPPFAVGDQIGVSDVTARQVFAKPPARYTEGSLVKKLEELGIGRPSTYATIIDTIQTRGYALRGENEGELRSVIVLSVSPNSSETANNSVRREVVEEKTGSDKGKLVPTPAGELIAGFLVDHFEPVVNYDFTATVETYFDKIASGELERNKMLRGFYEPFHALIDKSGDIDRSTVGSSREIGIDPKTGKPIIARFGRFGPMLQIGSTDDEDKPQFAPMPKGVNIDSVSLEQALTAFELPRLVGQTADGQDIQANVGRFGPYIKVGKLFVSIKPEDPHTISLEKSLELYAEKLQKEAEKYIAEFEGGIQVLNGRFGPYVTDGKKNVKVPKDTDPKTVTKEQAVEMLAKAPAKKTARKRTTTKRKTA